MAEPEPAEDELQRSLSALHSIGQQAARLEQMATTVSSNSASRTNLFESSQYQPASAWGEDADAYRGHIEARAGARSPTPDHMRGRAPYDDDDYDEEEEEEEEDEEEEEEEEEGVGGRRRRSEEGDAKKESKLR